MTLKRMALRALDTIFIAFTTALLLADRGDAARNSGQQDVDEENNVLSSPQECRR